MCVEGGGRQNKKTDVMHVNYFNTAKHRVSGVGYRGRSYVCVAKSMYGEVLKKLGSNWANSCRFTFWQVTRKMLE